MWHLKLIANYKTCIVSCSYRYLYRPMHSIPYDLRADTNRSPYLPASPNCASGPSYRDICPTRHRSRLAKLSSVLKNNGRHQKDDKCILSQSIEIAKSKSTYGIFHIYNGLQEFGFHGNSLHKVRVSYRRTWIGHLHTYVIFSFTPLLL